MLIFFLLLCAFSLQTKHTNTEKIVCKKKECFCGGDTNNCEDPSYCTKNRIVCKNECCCDGDELAYLEHDEWDHCAELPGAGSWKDDTCTLTCCRKKYDVVVPLCGDKCCNPKNGGKKLGKCGSKMTAKHEPCCQKATETIESQEHSKCCLNGVGLNCDELWRTNVTKFCCLGYDTRGIHVKCQTDCSDYRPAPHITWIQNFISQHHQAVLLALIIFAIVTAIAIFEYSTQALRKCTARVARGGWFVQASIITKAEVINKPQFNNNNYYDDPLLSHKQENY